MHRSRLYGIFIDVPRGHTAQAVAFWARALGATPKASVPPDEYTRLAGAASAVPVEVQGIDDQPRYHLDIETDDVTAEVARLTALGATEHARYSGWVVLRAPGGHLVCVVPVQSDRADFTTAVRTWDDED
jgi:hypothetical protein